MKGEGTVQTAEEEEHQDKEKGHSETAVRGLASEKGARTRRCNGEGKQK